MAPSFNVSRRLIESVFGSSLNSYQPGASLSDVTELSQCNDQLRWDRSWRTVTEALTLPAVTNEADLSTIASRSPISTDSTFNEALNDLLGYGSRIPVTSQSSDIIIWYTNSVRRHYLDQVLPILKRSQKVTHSTNPKLVVKTCIRVLEDAHSLYYEGMSVLEKQIQEERVAVKNFRPNLSTVVSNSIVIRGFIETVLKKHIVSILEHDEDESELLRFVSCLNNVGLGGEKFQIMLADVMDHAMRNHVNLACGGIWNEPVSESASAILPRAVQHTSPSKSTTDLCEWIENRYAKLAVQVFRTLKNSPGVVISWDEVEKWKIMGLGHLARLRTEELYDIVAQWPDTLGGLSDLRTAIMTSWLSRFNVTEYFKMILRERLLHPGASTIQILQKYITMIRSFHFLDHSDVLLSRVAYPLQLYLCSRDDTVRIVIAGLLSDTVDSQGQTIKPGGDKLVELALLLDEGSGIERLDEEELDWHDLEWVPDPVDAGPGYKRSKRAADIIGTFIRLLGSQDVFIREFQSIISENLLKQDGSFEKEIKVLDLLKARYGEAPLQSCEVMLKDIQDSGRVNAVIRHTQQLDIDDEVGTLEVPSLNAKILSRLYWPQLHDESYRIPDEITELQSRYENGYESLKSARKLTWLPALGQATVELELTDRTIIEEVLTWQATVIWAFESEEPGDVTRSVEQLVQALEMDEPLVRSALKFWSNKLVLQEVSTDTYTVLESLNQEELARSNAQAAGSSRNTDDTQLPAQSEALAAEKMQMYWPFIQAMLTNSSSQMPLQQIAMMLSMLIADGFPYSKEELQEFLGVKVQDGELEFASGKYRLKK